MTVGSAGDKGQGPAIRLDERLEKGKSYQSETFMNSLLTEKTGFKGEEFEVDDIELFLL